MSDAREKYRLLTKMNNPADNGEFDCCDNMDLIVDGEVFCRNCYTVHGVSIESSWEEKRAYTREEKGSRSRSNVFDKYYVNHIKSWSKSLRGIETSPKEKYKYDRLEKINIWTAAKKNKTVLEGRSNIFQICSQLQFPKYVATYSNRLFEKIVEDGNLRALHASIEGMSAAVIYGICKMYGLAVIFDEIVEKSRSREKVIKKCYRRLLRNYNLNSAPFTPEKFVPRIINELGLSNEVEIKSKQILSDIRRYKILIGKKPEGLASSAVYIATILCNERRSQKQISELTKVTEVTIRSIKKSIVRKFGLGKPPTYMHSFVQKIGLSEKVEKKALGLLPYETDFEVIGPARNLAAAALYAAAELQGEKVETVTFANELKLDEEKLVSNYDQFLKPMIYGPQPSTTTNPEPEKSLNKSTGNREQYQKGSVQKHLSINLSQV